MSRLHIGLPFPSPGDLPNTGIEPGSPALQADTLPSETPEFIHLVIEECSNYCTTALISHASKLMLKNLQARLQQYVNCELPLFKLVLEKAEEPEIKLPTSSGSSKKQESSRKTPTSASLTMLKPFIVWITTNCGKPLKR